jgi:uncharacterized lipoprotein YbaY
MKRIQQIAILAVAASTIFTACKKEELPTPAPVEQELITTVRLIVTNSSGFNKTFNYKVDNGFGSSTQGNVRIDDVALAPGTNYDVEVQVWDESKNPAENITQEVIAESHHHLFIFRSNPASGAGSIAFSNGNKDDEGEPLNQKIAFTTGAAGNGSLTVTLKHEPTNKNAANAAEAGGETDAEAIFPVKLQ